MSVRVRFAPSPTGYLHVGGARTALYNYLYAKKMGGTFVLRIEDTDRERSTDEALKMQISDLQWLGLKWDEGVNPETLESFGEFGPYRQSERLDIYKKYAEDLLQRGLAYYDFRSDEELQKLRDELFAKEKIMRVPRPDVLPTLEEAQKRLAGGETAAVRFKVPEQDSYKLQDMVRGDVEFPSDMVGDFIIMRSTGMPVYNFCCVIDDALMKITHVFRAEEHLNNTLRQKMIYQALGFECPEFAHLSLVLGQDKQKLSKRHGATSCNEYQTKGFLPEALNNYIALLGWSSKDDQEIFEKEELIQRFDPSGFTSSGAVFDEEKLTWMNGEHLKKLPHDVLWPMVTKELQGAGITVPSGAAWAAKALELFRPYMSTLNDVVELFKPIDEQAFKIEPAAEEVLGWESTEKVFAEWSSQLEQHGEYLTSDEFVAAQNHIKKSQGVKGKHLFMPIRVAVIGKPHGAELKALVPLLNTKQLKDRLEKCMQVMNG